MEQIQKVATGLFARSVLTKTCQVCRVLWKMKVHKSRRLQCSFQSCRSDCGTTFSCIHGCSQSFGTSDLNSLAEHKSSVCGINTMSVLGAVILSRLHRKVSSLVPELTVLSSQLMSTMRGSYSLYATPLHTHTYTSLWNCPKPMHEARMSHNNKGT